MTTQVEVCAERIASQQLGTQQEKSQRERKSLATGHTASQEVMFIVQKAQDARLHHRTKTNRWWPKKSVIFSPTIERLFLQVRDLWLNPLHNESWSMETLLYLGGPKMWHNSRLCLQQSRD